jgi:hypothetical protein
MQAGGGVSHFVLFTLIENAEKTREETKRKEKKRKLVLY